MSQDTARTRVISLQVDTHATAEAVWKALTDAEELKRWFSPEARVVPGPGGSVWLSWGPGAEGEGRIETWEPPRRFGWVEEHGDTRLAVDWEIEAIGGGKIQLRLVQSGFGTGEAWDDWYDATRRGWAYFLENLRHYLEVHRGTPRALVWTRRSQQRPRGEAWQRLFGPEGFALPPSPAPGQICSLHWDDSVLVARVLGGEAPYTFAALLPDLGQALLFVEMEPGPTPQCGVWLSTYGQAAETVNALQAELDRMADRAFAES